MHITTHQIVAHNLSTVKKADQIAVLDGGTIAEIGTHDELINKGGPYARLVKLQKMVNYINQESEQLRSSSTTRTSTSGPNVSSASPMPVTKTVSIKDNYVIPPPAPSFFRLLAMNAPEWRQAAMNHRYFTNPAVPVSDTCVSDTSILRYSLYTTTMSFFNSRITVSP